MLWEWYKRFEEYVEDCQQAPFSETEQSSGRPFCVFFHRSWRVPKRRKDVRNWSSIVVIEVNVITFSWKKALQVDWTNDFVRPSTWCWDHDWRNLWPTPSNHHSEKPVFPLYILKKNPPSNRNILHVFVTVEWYTRNHRIHKLEAETACHICLYQRWQF